MLLQFEIIKYDDKHNPVCDKFVLEKSIDGTFQQIRSFFDYYL